jgi:hypothetical protein
VNTGSSARGEGQGGAANSHTAWARAGTAGLSAPRSIRHPVGPSVACGWSVPLSSLVARTAVVVLS